MFPRRIEIKLIREHKEYNDNQGDGYPLITTDTFASLGEEVAHICNKKMTMKMTDRVRKIVQQSTNTINRHDKNNMSFDWFGIRRQLNIHMGYY